MNSTLPSSLRVLVTDDTAVYRRLLSDVFSRIPGVEVAGTSFDGEDCLAMLEKLSPDFVTLDINMPRRDGLSTLEEIKKRKLRTQVVMVSSATEQSAEQTLRALRNGALDMILKPSGQNIEENRKSLEEQLLAQVETIRSLVRKPESKVMTLGSDQPKKSPLGPLRPTMPRRKVFECLCVGVSTGGPTALGTILPTLPKDLPVPILIVQHMPPVFTKSLADHLAQASNVPVSEAKHGEHAKAGHVYIAPGGRHMKVIKKSMKLEIQITDDAPVASCKPSVDYLFESVAQSCGGNVLAMILTGMGSDGLAGCRSLASLGAHTLAQSADTCVVYGMPRQIIENNLANEILPLNDISARLVQLLKASS